MQSGSPLQPLASKALIERRILAFIATELNCNNEIFHVIGHFPEAEVELMACWRVTVIKFGSSD
jgi:hypothetical protein